MKSCFAKSIPMMFMRVSWEGFIPASSRKRRAIRRTISLRLELVIARRDVALVVAEHGISQRQACRLLEVDRSTYRYEPRPDRNAQLRTALVEAARQKPRFGYRRLWVLLTARQGFRASVGRVLRLYRKEGLAVRRLKRKRLKGIVPANPLVIRRNQEWGLDFVSDAISNGRALRALTMVDSYTRDFPAIEVDTGISSRQVTRTLERVMPIEARRPRCAATTDPSLPADTSLPGVRRRRSSWCTFNPTSRCRMDTWKALTDGCAMSI
jgi:putative transposase